MVAATGEQKVAITTTGVLDVLEDDEGGVLVYERDSYPGAQAPVPRALIERYGLQRGHIVEAQLHPHREHEVAPLYCVSMR